MAFRRWYERTGLMNKQATIEGSVYPPTTYADMMYDGSVLGTSAKARIKIERLGRPARCSLLSDRQQPHAAARLC